MRPKVEPLRPGPTVAEPSDPALNAAHLSATTACWLDAVGRAAGALGLVSAAACAAMVVLASAMPVPVMVVSLAVAGLLLALVERVLALRVRFDAGLFRGLASAADLPAALHGLDAALQGLGLRSAGTPATPRPLAERVQGARRLARWHLVVAGLQAALLLAMAIRALGLALVRTGGMA